MLPDGDEVEEADDVALESEDATEAVERAERVDCTERLDCDIEETTESAYVVWIAKKVGFVVCEPSSPF